MRALDELVGLGGSTAGIIYPSLRSSAARRTRAINRRDYQATSRIMHAVSGRDHRQCQSRSGFRPLEDTRIQHRVRAL